MELRTHPRDVAKKNCPATSLDRDLGSAGGWKTGSPTTSLECELGAAAESQQASPSTKVHLTTEAEPFLRVLRVADAIILDEHEAEQTRQALTYPPRCGCSVARKNYSRSS